MEIMLSENRKITSDKRQYELRKLKIVKGKEVWEGYMFFSSLQSCLKAVPEQMLKESNANGWKECKNILTLAHESINEAFNY